MQDLPAPLENGPETELRGHPLGKRGPGHHQPHGDDHEHGQRECEGNGREPDLPPRASLLDVVDPVHRIDCADDRRRAAPHGHQNAERQQAAVLPLGDGTQLLRQQIHHCRWCDAGEVRHQLFNEMSRQEAGQRDEEQDCRHQGEHQIKTQLRSQAENTVFTDLVGGSLDQLGPRERYLEGLEHAVAIATPLPAGAAIATSLPAGVFVLRLL